MIPANVIGNPILQRLQKRFSLLYGPESAQHCMERLVMMLGRYGVSLKADEAQCLWSEKDCILITYGDMVQKDGEKPLESLDHFLTRYLQEVVNAVHILPFSPYSSDDGFSVIDYRQVNPDLGGWNHIVTIAMRFRLMADLVLNHVSRESEWFANYEKGVAPERDYFIEMDPETDLSQVVRPRVLPLLTEVQSAAGPRHVWTTFSDDQIDLDFQNPDVLFEFLDILLYYLSLGASVFRLDAIAYLWKKVGTSCIHLPETHEVVKIFRDVLELVAPNALLLTETNVPHEENVSYFGEGDEAHVVYQFSLPPLLLHALQVGTSEYLTRWAAKLHFPEKGCTFLNFTASHDGIGVRPLEGLLSEAEIQAVVDRVKANGGRVSSKKNPDGSETPYELNITYFDGLGKVDRKSPALAINRFLCSQTIALGLRGIPAVYFNNLVGGRNDLDGLKKTGRARSINRQKWQADALVEKLESRNTISGKVFREYCRRLSIRRLQPAFHPDGPQETLNLGKAVFAFLRAAPDKSQQILCLHNMTDEEVRLAWSDLSGWVEGRKLNWDLLADEAVTGKQDLNLPPYASLWLTQNTA